MFSCMRTDFVPSNRVDDTSVLNELVASALRDQEVLFEQRMSRVLDNHRAELENSMDFIATLTDDIAKLRMVNADLRLKIGVLESRNASDGVWEGDDHFSLSDSDDEDTLAHRGDA